MQCDAAINILDHTGRLLVETGVCWGRYKRAGGGAHSGNVPEICRYHNGVRRRAVCCCERLNPLSSQHVLIRDQPYTEAQISNMQHLLSVYKVHACSSKWQLQEDLTKYLGCQDKLGLALTWWKTCQVRPSWKAVIKTLLRRT
jgi:hypothetical protein